MEPAPVPSIRHVLEVEAGLVGVRLAELGRDEHVLPRLVPEVVVEGRSLAAVLPAALELERLRVEARESAGGVPVCVSEHREDDVVARHAMDGVGARVSGRTHDLFRLDHLLDARAPRVVGHVDDVDARRAEARHDEVGTVGTVTRRAAAVPAEVVQLVAHVRHRRLVDDAAVLGVDDGEEVRRVDAGSLVQAGDVEELLGRRLSGLTRRGVERRSLRHLRLLSQLTKSFDQRRLPLSRR